MTAASGATYVLREATAQPRVTSFGDAYRDTILAPINFGIHAGTELISAAVHSGNGFAIAFAFLAAILFMGICALLTGLLAPLTATVIGLPRAAIVAHGD